MNTLDIIILIVFLLGAVLGMMKGFVKQLASLAGLVIGLLAAKMLYIHVAEKISGTLTDSMTFAQIIAFIAIWIAVPLAFTIVASLFTKAMEVVSLGWLNRWLGAGLGALKYLILASLFIGVLEYIDASGKILSKQAKEESVLYYPLGDFAGIFVPVAKELTHDIINAV